MSLDSAKPGDLVAMPYERGNAEQLTVERVTAADAQVVLDGEASAIAARGLTIARLPRGFACLKGPAVIGQLRVEPDRVSGRVHGRKLKHGGVSGWVRALYKAVKPLEEP